MGSRLLPPGLPLSRRVDPPHLMTTPYIPHHVCTRMYTQTHITWSKPLPGPMVGSGVPLIWLYLLFPI